MPASYIIAHQGPQAMGPLERRLEGKFDEKKVRKGPFFQFIVKNMKFDGNYDVQWKVTRVRMARVVCIARLKCGMGKPSQRLEIRGNTGM